MPVLWQTGKGLCFCVQGDVYWYLYNRRHSESVGSRLPANQIHVSSRRLELVRFHRRLSGVSPHFPL